MRNIEVRVSTSISKLESVLYSSEVSDLENGVSVILKGGEQNMPKIDTSSWGEFVVGKLFTISRGKRQKAQDRIKGDIPYYSASNEAVSYTHLIQVKSPKIV